MQLCGGLGEIQNFRHSHEIPQVTQFHIVTGSLAISISLATGQWPQSGLAAQAFLLDLEDPTRVIGCLQPGQGPASQSLRRLQARPWTLLQVFSQRRPILA